MALVSYIKDNDLYDIRMIDDPAMVESDADEALKLVGYDIDSVDEYKDNMYESIQQHLAYDIWKNDKRIGYVYNKIQGDAYLGCSINIQDMIGMVLGLKTIFDICDKHKIIFSPHGSNIGKFKSLIYGPSYRLYNNGAKTVTILRKDVQEKGYEVFQYLGIRHVV